MSTISIYTRNCKNSPADYYRIFQYVPYLKKCGYDVDIKDSVTDGEYWKNLNSYGKWWRKAYQAVLYLKICFRRYRHLSEDIVKKKDVIYIERELVPRLMPLILTKKYESVCQNSRVVWDFDDDIFEAREISERETRLLLKSSDVIQGIGAYSGTLIPEEYRYKYVALPTTDLSSGIDVVKSNITKKRKLFDRKFIITWVGTVSNLSNLDLVIEHIDNAAGIIKKRLGKEVKLNIVCNEPYKKKTENLVIKNIKWERSLAKKVIGQSHLGIMPLVDDKIRRGKGGFKLIQYLSEGVPIISSDVGFCREVNDSSCGYIAKKSSDWIDNIVMVASNVEKWGEISKGAYERYLYKFNQEHNAKILEQRMSGAI